MHVNTGEEKKATTIANASTVMFIDICDMLQ